MAVVDDVGQDTDADVDQGAGPIEVLVVDDDLDPRTSSRSSWSGPTTRWR